jgi:predicted transcriptional regulator
MSKRVRLFVLNEPYQLRLSASLAQEIGFQESIVLLQVEYLIGISNTAEKDGELWTYQSLEDLRTHFPWWSRTTIYRILQRLQDKGLIKLGNYNKLKFDKTQWIALDRDGIAQLTSVKMDDSVFQNETSMLSKRNIDVAKMKHRCSQNETTIPQTPTQTPTQTPIMSNEQKSFLKKYLDVMGYDAFSKKDRLIPLGDSLVPIGIKDALELLEQYGEPLVLEGAAWAAEKGMNPNRAARALKTALPNWKDNEIKERRSAGKDTKPDEIDTDELAAWLEGVRQNAEKIPG